MPPTRETKSNLEPQGDGVIADAGPKHTLVLKPRVYSTREKFPISPQGDSTYWAQKNWSNYTLVLWRLMIQHRNCGFPQLNLVFLSLPWLSLSLTSFSSIGTTIWMMTSACYVVVFYIQHASPLEGAMTLLLKIFLSLSLFLSLCHSLFFLSLSFSLSLGHG